MRSQLQRPLSVASAAQSRALVSTEEGAADGRVTSEQVRPLRSGSGIRRVCGSAAWCPLLRLAGVLANDDRVMQSFSRRIPARVLDRSSSSECPLPRETGFLAASAREVSRPFSRAPRALTQASLRSCSRAPRKRAGARAAQLVSRLTCARWSSSQLPCGWPAKRQMHWALVPAGALRRAAQQPVILAGEEAVAALQSSGRVGH